MSTVIRRYRTRALVLALSGACACNDGAAYGEYASHLETSAPALYAKIRPSYSAALEWLYQSVGEDGAAPYGYVITSGTQLTTNNEIRQLMTSRLIAELAQEDSSLRVIHLRNMGYWITKWYREEAPNLAYIEFDRKSKLGGNAMALRTIVASPYGAAYSEQAQRLENGILALMSDEGEFRPWYKGPPYSYDADYLLTFYSGEAILALLEYASWTGNNVVWTAATRAQEYYMRKYVDSIATNYYPSYVPWHTMSLSKLYFATSDSRYLSALFTLSDAVLKIQDRTSIVG